MGEVVKGMMFTEWVEWVERTWSPELADDLLDANDLPSGGAYTSHGTYDHAEMLSLFGVLGERTNRPVPELVRSFGEALFPILATSHPHTIADASTAFALLAQLNAHIHPEVRRLYPDAEVPTFEADQSRGVFQLTYRSSRPFADLAEGLLHGCIAWFDEPLTVERHAAPGSTVFTIRRTP